MNHVVILGAGFAGLEAAICLRKEGYRVTLVSERDFFFVSPTSIWIPFRTLDFAANCIDLRDLQKVHGFDLTIGRVASIRANAGEVCLENGEKLTGYDHLIVAMGMDKIPLPGIEHTLSICGPPENSLKIRDRIDALLAKGSGRIAMGFGGNPKDSSAVRGGPAFEVLFNAHHLLRQKGLRDRFELTFFAPMPKPGIRLGEKALKNIDMFFTRMHIQRRVGKKLLRFDPDAVVFEDQSRLEADFIMYIPGGRGHHVLIDSDLPTTEAGFVRIDDQCRVAFAPGEGPANIYAIGDSASLEGPEWRAKQGHIAEGMARTAAFNIIAADAGRPERQGHRAHLSVLCVMDSGNGAAFVYRDDRRGLVIPMPYLGHGIKKGWLHYFRLSKLNRIPRLPGM